MNYDTLLNDNTSKVWVVDKKVVDGVEITAGSLVEKNLMIFHINGTVNIVPMQALGEKEPFRGSYVLDSQNKELLIEFPNEKWNLSVDYFTEDSVGFTPIKESKPGFSFKIKPIPPL